MSEPVTKREPALIAGGIVTMLSTFMFVAPDLGIEIPDTVAKVITLILVVAASLGIRSKVTPVAAPKLSKGKLQSDVISGP